ncbi:MurR/RpiR family transcriptional regulator [Exiguobacterium profundum]|uniref:MurR/RpiR family transcriptional regulator n=1 Tax=Exiguobacterium TaxID=33986 RepID=UPI0018DADD46|nr:MULTISPECIES: MurR/RpiR family transcriptional regulator [Exiguobacterium]MCT4797328.1 MurR/RpiR family transcriptional regulator [Exiguobacterium profundum]MCV9900247.1 MurR/RpiR family transcriptional regulator [Exiguobacterium sp. N5]MDT0192496.1 MurR/RpiR family transcriptional regulator [Exiguobacterium sp. BG5(2022)]QPI68208.1 MurR/RpiR family transcriptional regulator [Exiguobacterium sp. PBE]
METMNGTARIRGAYSTLSKKEQRIADYILKQPEQIIHHTINQVADDLDVAESTVFRFCQRVGFKGYQALKIALASDVVAPLQDIHEDITETDTALEIAEKIFSTNGKTIESTRQILDGASLEKTVELFLGARRIEFFGSGGSAVVALDAYHKFVRSGLQVSAMLESHMQLMSASQLTAEDVAVVISHSGASKETLDIAKLLKEKGVPTIAITNYAKSPLSKIADVSLFTVSQETAFRSEALASRIAELSLIDALFTAVMIRRGDAARASLQQMREAIANRRV